MMIEPGAIVFCAAMQWEVRPILRQLQNVDRCDAAGVRAWRARRGGADIVVFRTGIGVERAAETTQLILDRWKASVLINSGCAGGLGGNTPPGSLVIADELLFEKDGIRHVYQTSADWQARLGAAAKRTGVATITGRVLTSAEPLSTAQMKQAAHAEFGALAVEMEGAAIARIAQERAIPFASVRAVLDAVDLEIPERPRRNVQETTVRAALRSARSLSRMRHFFAMANGLLAADRSLRALFRALLHSSGNALPV